MSSRNENAAMIEDELVKHGVERYTFSHGTKHANVTWFLNGRAKFYTFPKVTKDRRMKLNMRGDIRRWCKEMAALPATNIGPVEARFSHVGSPA